MSGPPPGRQPSNTPLIWAPLPNKEQARHDRTRLLWVICVATLTLMYIAGLLNPLVYLIGYPVLATVYYRWGLNSDTPKKIGKVKRKNTDYDPLWCKYQSMRGRMPTQWETEQERAEFFALHDEYGEYYDPDNITAAPPKPKRKGLPDFTMEDALVRIPRAPRPQPTVRLKQ